MTPIPIRNLTPRELAGGAEALVYTRICSSFKVRKESGRVLPYVATHRVEFCMTGGERRYRFIDDMRADLARR